MNSSSADSSAASAADPRLLHFVLAVALVLLWGAMFLLRLDFAPPNLMDNDQERPALYALDVLVNGQWIVQRDATNDITSKPPFYTWLVAVVALFNGSLDSFALYLPGALATLAVALLLHHMGLRHGGSFVGFWAAVAWLLSSAGFKLVHLARTDSIFALTVFLTALAGWHAYRRGRGWTWFWVAAAVATLTKGPLGLVLGSFGFLMLLLPSGDSGSARPRRRYAAHATGILLYLGLCGGWFLAAWLVAGQDLIDKQLGRELVGHATVSISGARPGENAWRPILWFLSRFLPWSPLAILALWRIIRAWRSHRRHHPELLYWAAFFLGGMVLFSVAPHQRWDHQYPLLPAASLLAVHELRRWVPANAQRRSYLLFPPLALVVLLAAFLYLDANRIEDVKRTIATREAAADIRRMVDAPATILFDEDTMAAQFYLGTHTTETDQALVLELLEGDLPAVALVRREEEFRFLRPEGTAVFHEWARWSEPGEEKPFLRLVSNRPAPAPFGDRAFVQNGLILKVRGARPVSITRDRFVFDGVGPHPRVTITNRSGEVRRAALQLRLPDGTVLRSENRLRPAETWDPNATQPTNPPP